MTLDEFKHLLEPRMTRDEFFEAVDQILGTQHNGATIGRGRWRRGAGSGRYPGRGLIRWHSYESITVLFHTPLHQGTYDSPDAALDAIRALTEA